MRIIKHIILLVLFSCSIVTAQDTNLSNMYRLAKTFEQSGEFEKAKKIYEDIYEAQPWNVTFLESLNNIYTVLKEYDKSIDLLKGKIESDPANVNYYGLLGNTYYTLGDTLNAYKAWEDGLANSKNNMAAYRSIINYSLQNRAFKKTIEFLKKGKALQNNSDVFSLDLARVYSMTMNFEKAAIEYCKIVKSDPTKDQIVFRNMIQFLTRPQAIDETINAIENYVQEEKVPEIYRILIQLYELKDDFVNAFEYVIKLESENDADGKEYFKFAQQSLGNYKYNIAAEAFEKLIEEYPNSPLVPPSRIGYAKSFELSLNSKRDSLIGFWKPYSKTEVFFESEYNKAIESYKRIYELYSNSDIKNEAKFRIGEIYLEKLNQPDTAIQYYYEILNSNAVSQFLFKSKLRIAEIFIREDNIDSAEAELLEILKNFNLPEDFKSEVNLLLGKAYFWEGKFEQASAKLSEVSKNLFDDNANDALQLMTIVNTLKKDSTSLAEYAEADLLAHQERFNDAAVKFEKLTGSQNPIISELAGLKYAQILIAEGKYNSALEALVKSGKESSLNMFGADFQYLTGEIKLYAFKDYEGALKAYRNVLENYGNSLYFDKSRQKIEYINEEKKKSI